MRRASIIGQYSKDSQTIETQEVYANNFFTRKANETDKVYNTKKIKCYVYTREDDMLNGVSVYIDVKTGKVIGGICFGVCGRKQERIGESVGIL